MADQNNDYDDDTKRGQAATKMWGYVFVGTFVSWVFLGWYFLM